MKKSGKVWVVVVLIVLVVLIAIGTALFLIYKSATDLSNADKFNTTASTDIYEPLVKSIILGEEQTVTDDNVNGIIATIMEKSIEKKSFADNKVSINGIAMYMQEDNICNVYVDLLYKNNIRLIFSAKANVQLDTETKTINMTISDSKIGSLSIPTDVVMKMVEPSLGNISSKINVKDCVVTIPSEYTFTFMKKEITIYITELEINNKYALVRTNSAMDVIKEFLDDVIGSIFD